MVRVRVLGKVRLRFLFCRVNELDDDDDDDDDDEEQDGEEQSDIMMCE